MHKKILIILFSFLIFSQSNADDLMKALSDAYYKNPELNAERENILVSKEDLKISRSEFLPSITITGSRSEQTTDKLTDRSGANTTITDVDTETQKITIEQTLFQGLGGKADLDKKIRLRFEQMIKMGALDEAKKNLVTWNENSLASKAIGASELIAHLKGELSINQAIENASISTRQYAKRQKTWIKTRMTDWDDITDLTL